MHELLLVVFAACLQPNRRCHPALWPQNHDFLTSTTTEQSALSVSNLTQHQENARRFPDANQTWGGGSRGARGGWVGGNVPPGSPGARRPTGRPPARTAAAARPPGHLPEEQEIRKTANANFAAAPMFPRRRGSRSKFSLDIQFPGSSSETNLLV